MMQIGQKTMLSRMPADSPRDPDQLIARIRAEWADPEFRGGSFPVPFAIDQATELAIKAIAREHNVELSLVLGSCYGAVAAERH